MSLLLVHDLITPDLDRLAHPALAAEIETAGATLLASLGQRAFDEPGLRPTPWRPRKSPRLQHPLLMLSHDLRQSIHAVGPEIRVPQIYAATHQLGSEKLNIPARPYLPVTTAGELTDAAVTRLDELVAELIRA